MKWYYNIILNNRVIYTVVTVCKGTVCGTLCFTCILCGGYFPFPMFLSTLLFDGGWFWGTKGVNCMQLAASTLLLSQESRAHAPSLALCHINTSAMVWNNVWCRGYQRKTKCSLSATSEGRYYWINTCSLLHIGGGGGGVILPKTSYCFNTVQSAWLTTLKKNKPNKQFLLQKHTAKLKCVACIVGYLTPLFTSCCMFSWLASSSSSSFWFSTVSSV